MRIGGRCPWSVVSTLEAVSEPQELASATEQSLRTICASLRAAQRRFYKMERLIELASKVRGLGARAIRDRVLEDLRRHCGDVAPADDVTLVVVRGIPHEGGASR